jgi:hypothetical protein
MSMSKKHFEALALALAMARPAIVKQDSDWTVAMRAVADVCQGANPRFNRQRFVDACTDWDPVIRDGRIVRA